MSFWKNMAVRIEWALTATLTTLTHRQSLRIAIPDVTRGGFMCDLPPLLLPGTHISSRQARTADIITLDNTRCLALMAPHDLPQ